MYTGFTCIFVALCPRYETFKVSFAADTVNPQFRNFKADFNVSVDATNWTTVTVPFAQVCECDRACPLRASLLRHYRYVTPPHSQPAVPLWVLRTAVS